MATPEAPDIVADRIAPDMEEEILKAVKFWKHPSLTTIPSKEKMEYLKSRGLSETDIHVVWEKVSEDDTNDMRDFISPPPAQTQAQTPEEEETPHKIALIAVGGMLGLTAAAAVRWLNGGDFALFPPVTSPASDKQQVFHPKEDENDDDEEEVQEPVQDNEHESLLSEQIQELTELVKAQRETQELVLQTVTAQKNKHVTDESMALLKTSQPLLEIEDLLKQLPNDNEIARKALDKLTKYLEDDGAKKKVVISNMSVESQPTTTTCQQTSSTTCLRQVIQQLTLENINVADLQSGCQVLYLYVVHLSSHPKVPRYRKIYTSNGSFQKVEKLNGGVELLLAVGFVESEGCLEWQPDNEQESLTTLQEASAALSILKTSSSGNDKETLCKMALSTLPRSCTPTPMPNDYSLRDMTMTPQSGEIISPPTTKKHPNVNSSLPTPYSSPDTQELLSPGTTILNEISQEDSLLDMPAEDDVDDGTGRLLFQPPPAAAFRPVLPKMQLAMREGKYEDDEETINQLLVASGDEMML